jgi:hypothetical protein
MFTPGNSPLSTYSLIKFTISAIMKIVIDEIPMRAKYLSFSILLTKVKGIRITDKQIPVINQGWKYQLCSKSCQNVNIIC